MSDRYRLSDDNRLDIVLSDFCPISANCADIVVALHVFTYGEIDVITYKYVINTD